MATCSEDINQPCPEKAVYTCPDVVMASNSITEDRWSREWSNNPVWLVRHLMRNFPYTVVGENWFDDVKNLKTATYCFTVVEDDTDAEIPVIGASDYASHEAGEFKRFRGTGRYTGTVFQQGQQYLDELFSDPDIWWTPPIGTPTVGQSRTYLTHRFTANGVINDKAELSNILFSLLLPTFRGFIRFNHFGRIEIDCRKPVRQTFQRDDTNAGVTAIPVANVQNIYKGGIVHGNLESLLGASIGQNDLSDLDYVLLGVGKLTAEVRRIQSVSYFSGTQTAVQMTSSGTIAVDAPTAFSTPTNAPAELLINLSGVISVGEKLELRFTEQDGRVLTWDYFVSEEDTNLDTVTQMFKTRLMASPSFREQWTADIFAGFPNRIVIRSQTGWIHLDEPTIHPHFQTEELIRVCEAYEDGRDEAHKDGKRDNLKDFRFNIREHETFHGVKCVYISAVQDFRETEIQPRISWDAAEQERNLNLLELDLRFVDTYRQAAWLVKSAAVDFVDGNLWASWGTGIRGLFHEEGDVVAVRHQTMQGVSWTPFTIEAVSFNDSSQETKLKAKLYLSAAYDDRIAKEEKFLESSLTPNLDPQSQPPPTLTAGGFSTTRTGDGAGDIVQDTFYSPSAYETFPNQQKYSPSGADKL